MIPPDAVDLSDGVIVGDVGGLGAAPASVNVSVSESGSNINLGGLTTGMTQSQKWLLIALAVVALVALTRKTGR